MSSEAALSGELAATLAASTVLDPALQVDVHLCVDQRADSSLTCCAALGVDESCRTEASWLHHPADAKGAAHASRLPILGKYSACAVRHPFRRNITIRWWHVSVITPRTISTPCVSASFDVNRTKSYERPGVSSHLGHGMRPH